MKLHWLRHLQRTDSSEGEAAEQEHDLTPAQEAVEQSKLALEQADKAGEVAERIAARARRIEQRNGFGQLLEKLTEPRDPRESGRNYHGHGHTA